MLIGVDIDEKSLLEHLLNLNTSQGFILEFTCSLLCINDFSMTFFAILLSILVIILFPYNLPSLWFVAAACVGFAT